MTELNDMKDAPKDGSDILVLCKYIKYWVIVHYNLEKNCQDNSKEYIWWSDSGLERTSDAFEGWIPLPPIPERK